MPNSDQHFQGPLTVKGGGSGRGVQHAGMRQANQRAVLTLVARDPGLFNAEIARRSGLAPQTVSAILTDLERDGLIRRGEVLRGRRGQPATPISIDPEAAYCIGCNLGWRHFEALMIDFSGTVLGRVGRYYAYPDARMAVDEIAAAVDTLRGQLTARQAERLAGIGIAAPNNIAGSLHRLDAPDEQIALWRALDLRGAVEAATGLDTGLYNDGNAACFSEAAASELSRPVNMVYLQVNALLKAGIIADNILWEGPTGKAANLGAMLVTDRNGADRFVFEIASLLTLEERLAAQGYPVPVGDPMDWPWDAWGPVLSDWLEDATVTLARTVINTGAMLELSAAIIDAAMPGPLIEALVARTRAHLGRLAAPHAAPQVLRGRLGGRAAAIGAAKIPIYRKFFAPTLPEAGEA